MKGTIRSIQAKLQALQKGATNQPAQPGEGRKWPAWNSGLCKYDLYPALNESSIQLFETKYQIQLPEGYRRFLLEIGNGGAGPFGGLRPLTHTIDSNVPDPFYVSRSFPLLEAFNFPDPPHSLETLEDFNPEEFLDRLGRSSGIGQSKKKPSEPKESKQTRVSNQDKENLDLFLSSDYLAFYYHARGTLILSEIVGAERFFWLIVTGEERGNIWVDSQADDGGIYPLPHPDELPSPRDLFDYERIIAVPGQRHCDFLTWYEAWLDMELQTLFEYEELNQIE